MPEIQKIDDAYIDAVIKASEVYNPNLDVTQGVRLRELIKLMRDQIEQQGENGATGADGLSAYQIWLNNGHTGTEADYLTSLKGEKGDPGTGGGGSAFDYTHLGLSKNLDLTPEIGTGGNGSDKGEMLSLSDPAHPADYHGTDPRFLTIGRDSRGAFIRAINDALNVLDHDGNVAQDLLNPLQSFDVTRLPIIEQQTGDTDLFLSQTNSLGLKVGSMFRTSYGEIKYYAPFGSQKLKNDSGFDLQVKEFKEATGDLITGIDYVIHDQETKLYPYETSNGVQILIPAMQQQLRLVLLNNNNIILNETYSDPDSVRTMNIYRDAFSANVTKVIKYLST